MKKYLFLLLAFSFSFGYSQNLLNNIPSNTNFVLEVNVSNLIKAAPFDELEKTSMGEGLIAEMSNLLEKDISSFDELGINTSGSTYVFMDQDGDNLQMVFLLPITGESVITKLMVSDDGAVVEGAGFKSYTSVDEDTRLYWNNNTLSIVQILERTGPGNSSKNYLNAVSQPIASNSSYTKQRDSEAVMSFWMNDLQGTFDRIAPFMGPMEQQVEMQSLANLYQGYESISLKLILNEKETRLATEMVFDSELAKTYKKMGKQKFNTEILNYVNLDDCLLYFSNNISVANALKEYPGIISEQIGALGSSEQFVDEAVLGMSLLSTLLDEDAIGEVIRGDMILVLNDLADKTVEYTDYEYDSNFNQIPVVREKTEKLPGFIFIASTKEGDLSKKTFEYLQKKNFTTKEGSYYKVGEMAELPFDLYFMIKNDIFFLGTSQNDFRQIAAGTYRSKVSADIRSHITKNQMALYGGPKKVAPAVTQEDIPNPEDYENIIGMLKESPDIRITSGKFKGNSITSSATIDTPAGYASGIMYILSIMERMR